MGGDLLNQYSYIRHRMLQDDLLIDIQRLLEDNGKSATFEHVSRVATVCAELAVQFGLDREKCYVSGLLHDISAVIKPDDMLSYAEKNGLALCAAERKYPFLLHQRLSAILAREYFDVEDDEILSAIACHTTLQADPSQYDMVLFIADKLAWDQEGTPPFYNAVSEALHKSLEEACLVYMRFMEETGRLLCPHTNWIAGREWLQKRQK